MTRQLNEILSFAIILVVAWIITFLIGWHGTIGFAMGVMTTLVAAIVAGGEDFVE